MSHINDLLTDEFQYTVNDLLIRNKSILDIITKFQDSTARINRIVVKSATQCGCIQIQATKQPYSEEISLEEIKNHMSSHVEGKLCEDCRDLLEKELGRNLFYLAALCNTLDFNLYDVLLKELERSSLLGKYMLR